MPSKQPTHSDASSSYWPAGWNFERFSRATSEDRNSLPEGELAKMQAGLRDALGDHGFGQLAMYLYRQEQEREQQAEEAKEVGATVTKQAETASAGDTTTLVNGVASNSSIAIAAPNADDGDDAPSDQPAVPILLPNWLKQWTEHHEDSPWGFIAFRTAALKDNSHLRNFTANLHALIDETFDRDVAKNSQALADKIAVAQQKFEIRWIDEEDDADLATATAKDLRVRFEKVLGEGDIPSGFVRSLFLCASPGAVDSVSNSSPDMEDDGNDRATGSSKRERSVAPYLLAVVANTSLRSMEAEEEEEEGKTTHKPVFKVAVEALVGQLWWNLDADITPVRDLTRWVKAADELGEMKATTDEDELEEVWTSSAPPIGHTRKRMRLRGIPTSGE